MKAIVINATDKTVTEGQYDEAIGYTEIYRLGGFDCFTVIELGDGETLYIDDEGLLKEGRTDFFLLYGPDFKYPQPLAGNGVILGCDDEGETVGTKLTVEKVAANVRFPPEPIVCTGFTEPYESRVDHPVLGKDTPVFHTGTPIFALAPKKEEK